jgi:hypothetical protein
MLTNMFQKNNAYKCKSKVELIITHTLLAIIPTHKEYCRRPLIALMMLLMPKGVTVAEHSDGYRSSNNVIRLSRQPYSYMLLSTTSPNRESCKVNKARGQTKAWQVR